MKKILYVPLLILALALPACAARDIQIITKTLPQGQTTVAYSVDLGAKFGVKPYTPWSIASGALPTGLAISTLSNGKGRISGTPTVAGTYNFVVQVVGGTTDTQSLFIIIAATAPPPTPAVSISTTSLPTGIVGGAYNATLQATGGTAPYTWSVTNGALPPAAALTGATGAIAGTLTASGTYSTTFRVTDSSTTPQTYDRAFAISVDQAVAPTYLFSDTLANGFAAWGFRWNSTDVTTAACPGGGNCAQFHYVICGDSTNPACGANHQDSNRWIAKVMSPSLSDAFIRGYVYHKTPEAGASDVVQRKMYWISDCLSAGGCSPEGWTVVLTTDETAAPMSVYVLASTGGVSTRYNVTGPLAHDTFYSIEMEVKLNTPGVSDGEIHVWVGGVEKLAQTGISIRGALTTGASFFSVGRQADRHNYNPVNEYRYWKNVVINSSGPIGP